MTEIEQLVLEVTSKGLADVNKKLDELQSKTKASESAWASMAAKVAAFTGAAVGIYAVVKALTEATVKYQNFNAQLITATHSQENATEAMDALVQFAVKTPYSLDQATGAFIKLVNLGLDPSEKALYSYGNTASALGHSLEEMVHAVADATVGIFKPLETIGIKLHANGDKVIAVFQGQRTEIDNTAAAIQKYLIGLGQNQFAGAMERQMKTLGGAISNIGDAWDQMLVNLSKEGPDSVITAAANAAGDALNEINAQLKSGEFDANLKAYGLLWKETFTDIGTGAQGTSGVIKTALDYWSSLFDVNKKDVEDYFKYFPVEAKLGLQAATVYVQKWSKDIGVEFDYLKDKFKLDLDEMVSDAKSTGSAISRGLHGDFSGSLVADIDKASKARADADVKLMDSRDKGFQQNQNILDETLAGMAQETKATEGQVDALHDKASAARKAFDDAQAAQAASGVDRLAKYEIKGGPQGPSLEDAKKAAALEKKLFDNRVKEVADGMARENYVVSSGYDEQRRIIEENTKTTEEEKKRLILTALASSVVTEEQNIKDSYDRRMAFILSATGITEDTKSKLILNLTKAREQAVQKIEMDSMNKRLDQASSFFGNIASIGSTFGRKGFKIAQGAAIAQATIDTYKAATGAYASLSAIPYVGPALGIAAAAAAVVAGAANIAKIKAQTYQGAYEHGGMISSGKYGIVGEAGPEIVQGPAIVTSASTTRENSRNGGIRTVTVMNHGEPVEATSRQNGEDLEIVLRPILDRHREQTKTEIAGDITRGGGKVSTALERTYGNRRA